LQHKKTTKFRDLLDRVGEAVFCNFEEARLSQPASDLAILLYTSTERSLRYSVAKPGGLFIRQKLDSFVQNCI
jgi:hypothetical protein